MTYKLIPSILLFDLSKLNEVYSLINAWTTCLQPSHAKHHTLEERLRCIKQLNISFLLCLSYLRQQLKLYESLSLYNIFVQYIRTKYLCTKSFCAKSLCAKSFWTKSFCTKSFRTKYFWTESFWPNPLPQKANKGLPPLPLSHHFWLALHINIQCLIVAKTNISFRMIESKSL